jgi:hypothetical protein
MRVDRKRFLALTFSMAGAGCNTPPAPASPPIDISLPQTSTAAPAVTTTTDVPDAAAPAPTAPTSTEGIVAGGPAEGRDEGWGDAGSGGACEAENAKGAPGDCAALRAPGPSCESFADTKSSCGEMRRKFRPRVAERVVNCVMQRNASRTVCDFDLVSKCVSSALRVGCADPSALTQCNAIVSQCKRTFPSSERGVRIVTTTECQALLGAVAPRNRGKMVSCMTEGCNAGGCYWDL